MALDFPANEVTAILGPSGSGKTALLSVITNSIQTNATCRAKVRLPGISSFVPQDDRLHGFYTVQTYLEHYARLAGLYDESTKDVLQERIQTLIQQLGLVEQTDTVVGDLFIKGLSGGQKRRLSIALEALSQPRRVSTPNRPAASHGISHVRAAAGHRVILTIHQPSSFIWQTIDHVILLSQGQLVYNGGQVQCESFFAAQGYPTLTGWNPADHYVTAINDEFRNNAMPVVEWATEFKEWKQSSTSGEGGANDEDAANGGTSKQHNSNHSHRAQLQARSSSSMHAASKAEIATHRSRSSLRTVTELTRYFLNLALNPGILGTRVAMYVMLALMIGVLFLTWASAMILRYVYLYCKLHSAYS
jgi:ABC-type multidrug transport system ATPase subunit